mgnify:FL=1
MQGKTLFEKENYIIMRGTYFIRQVVFQENAV